MREGPDPALEGLHTPLALLLHWVLPTLAFLAVLRLAWRPGREGPGFLRSDSSAWTFWLATRFAYAVVYWCLLDIRVDADMWHWDGNTRTMAEGRVVGTGYFVNYYGPLFPYLQFAGRWLTPGFHLVGTLWIFLLGDALAVFLGGRLAAALLGEEAGRWTRAWLLVDPLLWHQLVVRAQDESLFLGTLVACAWLLHRGRTYASMALLAFGLCATKISYAPYAMAVLLAVPGGAWSLVRASALWAGLVAAIYAGYLATGAALFSGGEVSMRLPNWGVGVSLPDAARRLLPGLSMTPALVLYAAGCFVVIAAVAWRFRALPPGRRAVLNLAAAHLASMLLMPCAMSPYLAQGLLFLLVLGLSAGMSPRVERFAFLLLALSSWLAVMYWTRSRLFSVPLKPVCIALHAGALLLLFRWREGGWKAGAGIPRESAS